ncbi:hypothetical protein C404_26815 [Ralstonia sp. AU12-08]|nr:hypothetical protein C404_26815 [Ralstonia sp. AU12-08]
MHGWDTTYPATNVGAEFARSIAMNKDQVKGRVEDAKGKVTEAVGKATGKDATAAKGKIEQIAGKARAAYGDAKEALKKQRKP